MKSLTLGWVTSSARDAMYSSDNTPIPPSTASPMVSCELEMERPLTLTIASNIVIRSDRSNKYVGLSARRTARRFNQTPQHT